MRLARAVSGLVGLMGWFGCLTVTGCTEIVEVDSEKPEDTGETRQVTQGQIVGTNDLVPVIQDGANLPAKYRPLVDAFGILSMGCTATHIGDGIAITAGHCFDAPTTRKNNVDCSSTTVKWGYRKDKAAYLESKCTKILAEQWGSNLDYAIFRVSPIPPVAVEVDLGAKAPSGTALTIFGHPQTRPLEWSKTCTSRAATAASQFYYDCDTEPGNSGSTVLNDTTLRVVGIHDGALSNHNYGTHLASTPITEFVSATPNVPPTVLVPAVGQTSGTLSIVAHPADSDGRVTSVVFTLPDGSTVEDTSAPYEVSWKSTTVVDGSYPIRVTATDDRGATASATVTATLANGISSCATGEVASTGAAVAIPDNNTTGISSSLSLGGPGRVLSLALSTNITHTYRGDLVVALVSPSGAVTTLHNKAGGSADDLKLDGVSVAGANGADAAGEWRLQVKDVVARDVGSLRSWSLRVIADCAP